MPASRSRPDEPDQPPERETPEEAGAADAPADRADADAANLAAASSASADAAADGVPVDDDAAAPGKTGSAADGAADAAAPANAGSAAAAGTADADGDSHDEHRESAYGLLQRGHDLMRSRHHAQAATVLARAARLEPRKGSILEALGRAYYNSGQHLAAAETFETLLEVDPSAHYAHYALGQSLKQLGRAKEARTHLRLAVALSPNSRLYQAALDRLGPVGDREAK
jgi:tetratricopeptide (TPR) repeat protein